MLIGLHGKAKSGKDTVCSMIREDFEGAGCRVVRDAFADRLKLSAYRCFKPDATVEEALAWANLLKNDESFIIAEARSEGGSTLGAHITGRQFLQHYGTEAHRDVFVQDFWVDAVLPDWQDDDFGRGDGLTVNDILVITDVRFTNEAERILECGGVVWHVVRPEAEVGDTHASEQMLPSEYISYTIENLTSLEALRAKVHVGLYTEMAGRAA